LNIFHQNIRGLRNKGKVLINSFVLDSVNPDILCLSELHIEEQDLLNLTLQGDSLGSSYCCQNLQTQEVCIFVREDQSFNKIDNLLHCAEQTLEVCTAELETKSYNSSIIAFYRATSLQTLTNL
jgi:exonuclease III